VAPATPRWAAAAAAAALGALVVALALGGGAAGTDLAGIEDPGGLTRWGLPVARLVHDAAATVTIGFLLLPLLLPARGGDLGRDALRALRIAAVSALVWAAAAATLHLLTLSDLIGLPLPQALVGGSLASFTLSVPQGQATAAVLGLALTIAATARFTLRQGGAIALLLVGFAALVPTALVGHSATGDYHHSATTSLLVHLAGVTLWVGGLVALAWYAGSRGPHLARAARAFSPLALAAVVAVGASGVLNAYVRLTGLDDLWTTAYGRLVLAKVAALAVLVWAGSRHRRHTLAALDAGRPGAFARLAAGEVVVMAATMGLAVALSRTPPPIPDPVPDVSLVRSLLGFPVPPPPTPLRLLTETYPDAFFALACLAMTMLYLAGVRRLRRRGDAWPVGRTVAWLAGTATLAGVTLSGLMTYGMTMLSVHMSQHMVLAMAVPALLVLGAPMTLALRAIPPARRGERGPREALLAVLASRPVRVVTHPVVALLVFVTAAPMVYFSGLFELAMEQHTGHTLMSLHFLLGGYLFYEVVIGVDPLPSRPHPLVRVVMVLAAAGFHAFFGVGLLQASNLVAGDWYRTLGTEIAWLPDPLADQQVAAQITWGFGELPALLVLIVVVVQWSRSDEREARRRDRRVVDHELEDYNVYLAGLAARDGAASASGTLGAAPTGATRHGEQPLPGGR
jgi:putative copper resistance protein D